MLMNRQLILETAHIFLEAARCPKVKGFKSNSNIVKSWAKKFDVPESTMALFWRWAELQAARSLARQNKSKCDEIPYALAVTIFKAAVKKYLSKCDQDIKYALPNPEIEGEKVRIHYDEAKKVTLKEVIEQMKQDIRRLEKECPNV
jgi:hypothetical protein